MCVPRFCFQYKSLIFMPNLVHYTPKSLCYSTNGLIFTLKSLSWYVPMSAIPSVSCGGGGCCVLHKTSGRGGLYLLHILKT